MEMQNQDQNRNQDQNQNQNNITTFLSHWMEGTGPHAEVAISSRVRLARNVKGVPFPYLASDSQTQQVLDQVKKAVESQEETESLEFMKMEDLPPLVKQVMMEKHLISPFLATESHNSALFLRKDEAVGLMVNEEDHLRIQSILPGLQLEKAWEQADRYDNFLENKVEYSFHERYGYLTSCPTNVGTGLRASVMLHLPALIFTKQFNRVLSALSQVGLAVRGLYGEGTEIVGNLVQISNQITLGQSEEEIVRNLFSVTRQVIEQENAACQLLLNNSREQMADRSCRAMGILKYAHLISSQEAMQLISDIRLGFELGLISGVNRKLLNELLILIRPACLQILAGKELDEGERDMERARQIRKRLQDIKV